MNTHFSVTIRPRYENFQLIQNTPTIIPALKLKLDKYIISEEKGGQEYVNHYQCYFRYKKNTKTSNVRRQLLTLFKKNKIHFLNDKIAIKVKSIKSNLEGTIGYTLKENDKYFSNFSDQEISDFLDTYNDYLEKNKYDNKNFFRINNKNYHIYVKRYIIEHKLEKEEYDLDDIMILVAEMANKGYYFTFLNSRNTNEKLEYILHFLNGTMIEYIKGLNRTSTNLMY